MAKKKTNPAPATTITLAELTAAYGKQLEAEGKSLGTRFSYDAELRLAQRELGAETRISDLTRDDIRRFNESPRVTLLKSGKPKSQLSIDKTRRVLRLALKGAAETGLIETSPAEPVETTPTVDEVVAPKARKPRKRKQAIVLEVSQPEAEAAADVAESMVAADDGTAA